MPVEARRGHGNEFRGTSGGVSSREHRKRVNRRGSDNCSAFLGFLTSLSQFLTPKVLLLEQIR